MLACVLVLSCADPESYVRGGPILTIFFSLVNTTISWPSLSRQRNAIKCFAGVPMMAHPMNAGSVALLFFRGSRPVLLRNPSIL